MTPIARTTRTLARLTAITIPLAMAALPGCDEANKTHTGPTTATTSSASKPSKPTPTDLAQQAEQFANRLDQQQHAPTPYPPQPADPAPVPDKPAQVQWIKPQPAPGATPGTAPGTTPADDVPPPDAVTDAPPATAPAAAPAPEPTREELIKRLADDLKPRSAAQNAAVRPWLQRASLAVIDPSYEISADDLKSLSEEDRQLVLAWQRTFAQMGRSLSNDDKANRAALIDLADELKSQIQLQRNLAVSVIKLCTRVNGYGVYDAIDKPVFLAGGEHPVIVYAELENFHTKLDEQKRHVVQLSQEMVLYNDADGLPVWRQRPVAINDVSANQRRDFFTVQVIHLSDRLSVGKYILKLRVTDEVGSAVAEASLPLQIVADAKLTNEK